MMNKVMRITLSILALTVTMTLFIPQWMITPGNPVNAHSEISSDCFACHSPFSGSTATKCMECHRIDEIGLQTTQGESILKEEPQIAFHQELVEADCVACHSDHQGVKPFRSASQFSHHLLKPAIQKKCKNCHSTPQDRVHSKTEKSCSSCHSSESWATDHFDHKEYFRFDRYHDAECDVCHESGDYSQYTCYGCHEHSPRNIRGEHLEEGIYNYEVCVECHRSGDEHEAEWLWKQKRMQDRGGHEKQQRSYYRYGHDDDHEDEEDDDDDD